MPITPRTGTLSILDVPNDAEVVLDGVQLPQSPTKTYEVAAGYHDVEIRSASLNRFAQMRIRISPYLGLGVSAELGYRSQKSLWFSLLLPGSGQIYDRSVYEGVGYAAGTAGLIVLSTVLNTKYQRELDAYRNSRAPYLRAMTEADINMFRDQMVEKKGSADRAYRTRNIAYSALLGLYVCNIVDALLFHSKDDRLTAISLGRSAQTSFMIVPDTKQFACRLSVKL